MKTFTDFHNREQKEYTLEEVKECELLVQDYRLAMAARFIIGFIASLSIGMATILLYRVMDFIKH